MGGPGTLLAVRFVFRNKPKLSALSHVAATVSVFLDSSVELPLHKACKFESLSLLDRIWNSTVDMEPGQDAAWSVRNLLRTEAPHYHQYQFSKCLLEAIKLKNLTIVEWLFEHFPDTYVRPEVEAAAAAGALDILKYFRANDEEINSNAQWPHEVEWEPSKRLKQLKGATGTSPSGCLKRSRRVETRKRHFRPCIWQWRVAMWNSCDGNWTWGSP